MYARSSSGSWAATTWSAIPRMRRRKARSEMGDPEDSPRSLPRCPAPPARRSAGYHAGQGEPIRASATRTDRREGRSSTDPGPSTAPEVLPSLTHMTCPEGLAPEESALSRDEPAEQARALPPPVCEQPTGRTAERPAIREYVRTFERLPASSVAGSNFRTSSGQRVRELEGGVDAATPAMILQPGQSSQAWRRRKWFCR